MVSTRHRNGLSVFGLGAAACVACCAGPLLAFLGGITIAGTVGTVFVGTAGLLVATVGAAAFAIVRRRSVRCTPEPVGPVAVSMPSGRPSNGRRPN